MNLNEKQQATLRNIMAMNHEHKHRKAALKAFCIFYSKDLSEDDAIAMCQMANVPISFANEVREGLLIADRIKQLQALGKKDGNKDK